MKYLLDTNVFLWISGVPERLNQRATSILSAVSSELYLSAVTSWEIAIKFAIGSLTLPSRPSQFVPQAMRALALRPLDITHSHSLAVIDLPQHHRDPFDRMLIAQAQAEEMVLLTSDSVFKTYDVQTLFCGR